MKICVLTGEAYTNLYFRILPLLKHLEKYGISYSLVLPKKVPEPLQKYVSVTMPYNIKDFLKIVKNKELRVLFISCLSSAPIWLLQRICRLVNKRVKVLFDLCDPIFMSKINLLNFSNIRSPAFSHLEKIVKGADYVTASSHYTLSYVKLINKRVELIHDPIDTDTITPRYERSSDKITIGWEGNPHAHFNNLAMLINPLKKLSREYEVRFKIVSWLAEMRVKRMFEKLEKSVEIDYGSDRWIPPVEHINLCKSFDILTAPLQKTPWYEGRSALRVGIGMAMGIPVVASPVGEQKYVIKHGLNGFIARNEDEWYYYLKILIEDDNLRKNMGLNGRKTAEEQLSLRVNGKKLYDLIRNITAN